MEILADWGICNDGLGHRNLFHFVFHIYHVITVMIGSQLELVGHGLT